MNYLGVYHSNYPRSTVGVCDAPCVSKGRMLLSAPETASEGYLLAMSQGRIRNRAELAKLLGCPANTSGAHLVLRAYQKWGTEYPKYIEGPVLTCTMDAYADRMILSRDRMGEQLIYYSLGPGGRIVFADHPDSLLKTASAEPVVDRNGLCEIFGLGPARTPGRTPLRDVFVLEPGCALICQGDQPSISRYFRIQSSPHQDDENETIRRTRELLESAVDFAAQLHPGAMLSGGIDSTALTALLSARNPRIQTFSVDYRDNASDFRPNAFRPEMDAPYINIAVRAFDTRHQTFTLEHAALADALEAAVSARGFPGMADIDSSLLLFAKKIAPFTPNIVSGECGDEVFGGYPWFRGEAPLREDAFPWSGSIVLRESILNPSLRNKLELPEYIRHTVRQAIEETQIDGPADDREIRLKRMQLICFRFFMANLQERAVRMCNQSGLNVLTPLCDDRLVQYVFNVPWSLKFLGGIEKGLFRAAVSDLMPAALNTRKKSPYPKTSSPIYTEIVRGLTTALLTDREAPILELIDAERIRFIASSSLDPTETPWFGQLMAGPQMLAYLWQVNTWMRERNITVSL